MNKTGSNCINVKWKPPPKKDGDKISKMSAGPKPETSKCAPAGRGRGTSMPAWKTAGVGQTQTAHIDELPPEQKKPEEDLAFLEDLDDFFSTKKNKGGKGKSRTSVPSGAEVIKAANAKKGAVKEVCQYFMKGQCMNGKFCEFKHPKDGADEKKDGPSGAGSKPVTPRQPITRQPITRTPIMQAPITPRPGSAGGAGATKTKMCPWFLKGNCNEGNRCPLDHGDKTDSARSGKAGSKGSGLNFGPPGGSAKGRGDSPPAANKRPSNLTQPAWMRAAKAGALPVQGEKRKLEPKAKEKAKAAPAENQSGQVEKSTASTKAELIKENKSLSVKLEIAQLRAENAEIKFNELKVKVDELEMGVAKKKRKLEASKR